MKTLDDVVNRLDKQSTTLDKHSIELEKHSIELEKHSIELGKQSAELERHSTQLDKLNDTMDELLKVTSQIQVSQVAMANAVTLLVAQLSDQKTTHARLERIEEDLRQLKQTH